MAEGIQNGYAKGKRKVYNLRPDSSNTLSHNAVMGTPAQNLKAWRERRGLTQEQLADRVGTTKAVISHLELERRDLGTKWLIKLADALQITPGFLFDHDPNDLPTDVLEIWASVPDDDKPKALKVLRSFSSVA